MLGIPAAAVTVMTLILSRGNFIAAIGAGIGTAVSVYVTNSRFTVAQHSLQLLQQNIQQKEREKQEIQTKISTQEELRHELKAEVAQLNAQKVEASEGINGLESRHKELRAEKS